MTAINNIQTVLVAPLDWGLGHATRCISIIAFLKKLGYKVMIAASGNTKHLLQKEFPEISFIELRGYDITYGKSRWTLPLRVITQIPKIVSIIWYEHKWLQKIIDEFGIDLVISDNRYGLYSKKIFCVFITHQLRIKSAIPFTEKILQLNNYYHIKKFNYCWIPDSANQNNVSGEMAHPIKMPKIKTFYIGLLSRFKKNQSIKIKYNYCIVLSGPEPQRTILEKMILKNIETINGTILLVRGLPNSEGVIASASNVEIKNYLPGNQLQQAFWQSDFIISRSGYTTVMEILSLQKKSILIATPGQTEQEYLSKIVQEKKLCFTISQRNLNLKTAIEQAKLFSYSTISLPIFNEKKLKYLLSKIK